MLYYSILQTKTKKLAILDILPAVPPISKKGEQTMKDTYAIRSVEESKKPAKSVQEAADLFTKLSPAAQDKIIDLIKSLLSKK